MKKFKYTIEGVSYSVDVKSVEGLKAQVEVNGKLFDVEMEKEVAPLKTPVIVRQEATSKPSATKVATDLPPVQSPSHAGAISVKAPLPGSIVRLVANVGDDVKQGDVLLVMESMKMENNILAEKAGKVSRILVAAGQNVMQDDLLVEMN